MWQPDCNGTVALYLAALHRNLQVLTEINCFLHEADVCYLANHFRIVLILRLVLLNFILANSVVWGLFLSKHGLMLRSGMVFLQRESNLFVKCLNNFGYCLCSKTDLFLLVCLHYLALQFCCYRNWIFKWMF